MDSEMLAGRVLVRGWLPGSGIVTSGEYSNVIES